MARHSLKLAGSPLHFRAFFNVRPHVISGHPFGLECATQPVSNYRGDKKKVSGSLEEEAVRGWAPAFLGRTSPGGGWI